MKDLEVLLCYKNDIAKKIKENIKTLERQLEGFSQTGSNYLYLKAKAEGQLDSLIYILGIINNNSTDGEKFDRALCR
jgi:hypothetical protein